MGSGSGLGQGCGQSCDFGWGWGSGSFFSLDLIMASSSVILATQTLDFIILSLIVSFEGDFSGYLLSLLLLLKRLLKKPVLFFLASSSLNFSAIILSQSLILENSIFLSRLQTIKRSLISWRQSTPIQKSSSWIESKQMGHWQIIQSRFKLYMFMYYIRRIDCSIFCQFWACTRNSFWGCIFYMGSRGGRGGYRVGWIGYYNILVLIGMLVVSTQSVPVELKEFLADEVAIRKMIIGYRNQLTSTLELVLSKNDNYCAQAYCFHLKQDETLLQKLKTYQNESSIMTIEQGNYLIVRKNQTKLFDPKQGIPAEELSRILQQLGSGLSPEAAYNLLLNCFDSYQQVEQTGLAAVLMGGTHKNYPNMESAQMSLYSGTNLYKVPTFDKKTGEWSKDHSHPLRIEITTKVPSQKQQNKDKNEAQIIQDSQAQQQQ